MPIKELMIFISVALFLIVGCDPEVKPIKENSESSPLFSLSLMDSVEVGDSTIVDDSLKNNPSINEIRFLILGKWNWRRQSGGWSPLPDSTRYLGYSARFKPNNKLEIYYQGSIVHQMNYSVDEDNQGTTYLFAEPKRDDIPFTYSFYGKIIIERFKLILGDAAIDGPESLFMRQ